MSRVARLTLILLPIVAFMMPGCGQAPAEVGSIEAQRPADLLANALESLKDERPTVAGYNAAVQQLDTYLSVKKDVADKLVLTQEERALLERQLLQGLFRRARPDDPNTLENRMKEVERKSFTLLDAHHLDACFLFRDAAQALRQHYVGEKPYANDPKLAEYELNLAEQAFAWVIRQVHFRQSESQLHPWPVHDILRRGTGDGEERARVFLALLEQLGLPGCMVSRITEKLIDGKREPQELAWAPGVLIGGDVYLFESRLGKPILGPGRKGIATLKQVRSDGEILKALYQGDEDPVTPAQLERTAILLPSSLPALSPRMRELQAWLVDSGNPAVVYQDLLGAMQRFRAAKLEADVRAWTNRAGYPAVTLARHVENPRNELRYQETIVPRKALMPRWVHELERQLGPPYGSTLFRTFDSAFLNLRVQPTSVQEVDVAEQGTLRMPGVTNQPRRVQMRTGGVRDLLVRGRPEQAVDRALDLEGKLDKMIATFYAQVETVAGKTERDLEKEWAPRLLQAKRQFDELVVQRQGGAGGQSTPAVTERQVQDAYRIFDSLLHEQTTPLSYLAVIWGNPELLEHLFYFMSLAKLELAIRAEHQMKARGTPAPGVLTPLQQWESAADWFERYQAHVLPRTRNYWAPAAERHLHSCREAITRLKASK